MEIKDISLDGKPWNTSEIVGKGNTDSMKEAVRELNQLIKERESLSNDFSLDAEKIKSEISNFIAEIKTSNPEVIKEKVTLKQKQIEISELQLKEKVNCWQDIAKLKQELRERELGLNEKQGRMDVLDRILEE
ncbi:MAG: hypothetical protein AABW67_03995 [Nanoarchaeota archaeon]